MDSNGGTESSNMADIDVDSILDAVRLIAALKPEVVAPFSVGNVGGVKIISSPMVPEGSIIVSDDIYLALNKISQNRKGEDNE